MIQMNIKALIAEFIGTFTLIFIGVMAIAHGSGGLVGVALAHGLAIAVMVSATAAISGGHLNPAVTLGALVGGKIKPVAALGYLAAQCAGAIVAALAVKLAVPADMLIANGPGVPVPGPGVSLASVIAIEAILTFFLVFVVFGTAVDARAPKVGGLFIGLTVALDILAGGPLTGAAMNPARHLGPALLLGDASTIAANLGRVWVYWVGPVLGGVAAGWLYSRVLEAKA